MRYTLGVPLPLHLQFLHASSHLFDHGSAADGGKRICTASFATPHSSPTSSHNWNSNTTSCPPFVVRPHFLVKPQPQCSHCRCVPMALSPSLSPVSYGWLWRSQNQIRGDTKRDWWRQRPCLHGYYWSHVRKSPPWSNSGFYSKLHGYVPRFWMKQGGSKTLPFLQLSWLCHGSRGIGARFGGGGCQCSG